MKYLKFIQICLDYVKHKLQYILINLQSLQQFSFHYLCQQPEEQLTFKKVKEEEGIQYSAGAGLFKWCRSRFGISECCLDGRFTS